MARMVFLHCFRTALLMLILTSAVSHAGADSLKTLQAEIDVNIKWNIDKGSTNRNGSLLMQIAGTMKLDPRSVKTSGKHAFVPVMLHYSLDGLTGNYNYQDTLTDKNPHRRCEPLLSTYKGIGAITAARGSLMRLNRMKHLASPSINKLSPNQKQYFVQIPGQELLLDYYDLSCGFAAQPSTVPGKSRGGTHDCSYSDRKKSIGLGNILLGFKIPDSGEMEGHRKWTAHANSKPSFAISLADLPERMRRPAYKPAESPVGNVTYNVTWAFGKAVKPFDVNVSEVSFKYTDGSQDQERCLQLLHHGPEKPVKPPEWTDNEKIEIEPAAFVRDYAFKVKAVFKSKRPVETAENFRAIEDFVDGQGFGGKLTQIGDLTITDNRISGEFIIKTPQKVIGTHWVRWQWKGDIKFKDEPGKIPSMELGKTEHTIHIVGGVPKRNVRAFKYAVELGCEWAKGLEGGNQALDAIWKNFQNIPAPDRNLGILSYKHKTPPPPGNTNELLDKGEGICGAWADFFKDTVGIHGIEMKKTGIYPKNPKQTVPAEPSIDHIVVREGEAQGNPKPSRVFTEHILNKYNGIYYDPSYYAYLDGSLNDYENEMFHGYCSKPRMIEYFKNPQNSGCEKINHIDDAQEAALIADCLIKTADENFLNPTADETGCIPNRLDVCEVYETVVE